MGFAKRVKKCIQEEGAVCKDIDTREIAEVAVTIENQSGARRIRMSSAMSE